MSLGDILVALVLVVAGVQFWRIRAITEQANRYLTQYCDKQDLQLIAVARRKTRLGVVHGKLDWLSEFAFEFSANGEDAYTGTLSMRGMRAESVDTPVYRVN